MRLHRKVSRRVGMSAEKETPQPPGQPGPGSATLTRNKLLLKFKWNLLCSSLHPLPLVLSLVVTRRAWLHPPDTAPLDICKHE